MILFYILFEDEVDLSIPKDPERENAKRLIYLSPGLVFIILSAEVYFDIVFHFSSIFGVFPFYLWFAFQKQEIDDWLCTKEKCPPISTILQLVVNFLQFVYWGGLLWFHLVLQDKTEQFLYAVEQGNLPLVKTLSVDPMVSLNVRGAFNILKIAREPNRIPIVDYLLSFKKRPISFYLYIDETELMTKIPWDRLCLIQRVLADERANVNDTRWSGKSLLWMASDKGCLDIVKLILASGKSIHTKEAATEIARYHGHNEIVALLESFQRDPKTTAGKLRKEFSVNRLSADFNFAVYLGFEIFGNDRPLRELIFSDEYTKNRGHYFPSAKRILSLRPEIDPNWSRKDSTDKYSLPPFLAACRFGYEEIVRELLCNERVNVVGEVKETALWLACFFDHEKVVRLLLEDQRIDVNQADVLGRTPLWIASRYGNLGIVRTLLASGKRINTKKRDVENGLTAAGISRRHEHSEIVALLKAFEKNSVISD